MSEFDVVVYGATGFTGRLVAEYLNETYGHGADVKWAMAGRSADKLQSVRDQIGASAETPLIEADASDKASLEAMAARTRCVISTVGPYTLYGEALVEVCASTGTDYVDLCGEPLWMMETIKKYDDTAKKSGARIVHSCGFDSIPTDLGVWFLQEHGIETHGAPAPRVRGRVRAMKGGASGGTVASFKESMTAIAKNPALKDSMTDPFALTEGKRGPNQPTGHKPYEETETGMWVAPFIMAAINTKNIHRSNMLTGYHYGADFVYDEMVFAGAGEAGQAIAEKVASSGFGKDAELKPGEGPSKEERESGFFDFLMIGEYPDGKIIKAGVKGDRDPGYGSTSKMLAESALCLINECADAPAGVTTPAASMGSKLCDRLANRAGVTFEIEE